MNKADLFLTKALGDKPYQKSLLPKEGSGRRYFRVFILPQKLKQLKTLAKPLKNQSPFFVKSKKSYILSCDRPLLQKMFLQKLRAFSAAGLNVPKVYAFYKGFCLLEDLGNHSLEQEKAGPYYQKALKQILKMQNLSKKNLKLFTEQDFFNEMLLTEKHFIKNFCKLSLNKSFRKKLLKEWKQLCQSLTAFPKAPAHRDFHSRNLFIKNKKIYMIDFQDAGLFPRFYDVVSLLYDVYPRRLSLKDKKSLFNFFVSWAKKKMAFSDQTAGPAKAIEQEVFITALQRLFKAVGSFARFYQIKNQKSHLKYIPPALKMIKRLLKENGQSYPFFRQLMDQLCP